MRMFKSLKAKMDRTSSMHVVETCISILVRKFERTRRTLQIFRH